MVAVPLPGEGEEQPKKRGRPKGSRNKAEADNADLTVECQILVGGVFAVLASKFGSHWNLTTQEVDLIASPLAKIIKKYVPVASSHSDEVALLAGIGMVVVPRLMMSGGKQRGERSKPATSAGAPASSSAVTNSPNDVRNDLPILQ